MGLSPARRLALKVVRRVRERDSFAPEAMQSAVSRAQVSSRDKAFATRLAYGTIATRGTLNELVATELSRPDDTPGDVKDALAIAAYELFFENTEPYVVVNQGVELVRFATRSKTYSGLSNAVLRRLSEKRNQIFPGGDPLSNIAAAARLHGHPLWIAELLQEEYGAEAAGRVMAVNNEPAPLYVAQLPFLQSEKQSIIALEAAGIEWESAGIQGALLIKNRAQFWALNPTQRKSFVAMDLAAQQVVALCGVRPDQRILEVGSGRGMKSLALAASARRLGGPASLIGLDLHDFKTKVAQRAAAEYGAQEVSFVTLDVRKASAKEYLENQAGQSKFDTVLVDAPCSGLGTLRRAVDKRWKLQPEDVNQLAQLGLKMLNWSSQFVVPGGSLLYATCTIAEEENQKVVHKFLDSPQGKDYAIEPLGSNELAPSFSSAITPEGYLNALPQSEGPDGHFAARLKRKR
ncbi:MAG: methyltransferase domain-containing protein [Coriobacteriia bacterium]|nr:methyltransferase domain-containing protein [Coriobacteriia bacterium]MCL2870067.1 methyltransferase domain-containing protein [Coriobacteriia bacterium]